MHIIVDDEFPKKTRTKAVRAVLETNVINIDHQDETNLKKVE